MAIVKMKRVGFVGPADARAELLDRLQDAAIVDPVALTEVDEAPSDLTGQRLNVQRVITALQARRKELKKDTPATSGRTDRSLAESTLERAEALLARRNELDNRLSILVKEREQLEPWGDFDPTELAALADRGVHLRLYHVRADQREELDLSGARWTRDLDLSGARGKQGSGLAVLSLDAPLDLDLEQATLPSRSLSTIRAEIDEIERELESGARELGELSANLEALQRYERYLQDQLRKAEVTAGLGGDEELFALSGWCPAEDVDTLRDSLQGPPVALLDEEPDEDDEPPIKLRNGPLVRQFEPLLKAFNLPSYGEYDPTLFIAPFMGIFFGFCLGDLGYGVVLAAVAAWALVKFKPQGEFKLAVQWMVLLGVSTIVIGGLTGNCFGVQLYKTFGWSENLLLFQLNAEPQKFFYASLVFGVIQLTVGMLIRLVRYVQLAMWQHVIGQLGWLSVFPAIAVWIMAGTPMAFLAALVVILLFASPSPSVVRRIGGGAWALYNITGLVGDVMSYARIFGLGLSSGIIAMVVNTIAMTIAESIPVLGWVLAVLVLIAGHAFNFVMALIGSVVHPARLQFLEFFGKFFDGGGRAYTPFQKLEGE